MENGLYKIELGSVGFHIMTHDQSFIYGQNITESTRERELQAIHAHSSYELFAVFDGEIMVCHTNGKATYSNCIVIIPPLFRHYVLYRSASAVILNFSVTRRNETLVVQGNSNSEIFAVPMTESQRFYCEKLMEAENGERRISVTEPLLYLLFAEIVEPLVSSRKQETHKKQNHYTAIIDTYIATNLNFSIRLTDVAEQLHLCTKQTARIIKKEYGCTLTDLIRNQKINISVMMLTKTDMKICDIATSVGYDSAKDFRVNFKRICGVSPTEYRKRYRL